ncbi:hypothetical protein [Helicobacter trogontum]|uniref:Serine protease n=1 Tax=Helicobacter trogontum TaxID=50960 RepID=A0A4U8TF38_9HELI|nr:hypothetical protein [Helicobacter trogontum]MCI5786817.1 hypothetical protein [Helicobacter trogontum]MDY5184306.1 hypothetical protein [Helicobacter trogontum]TLD97998.1 hypothetical protein LS80_006360 [Helicobacter trogontum]
MSLLFSRFKLFILFFILSCSIFVLPLYADGFADCNDLYGCMDNNAIATPTNKANAYEGKSGNTSKATIHTNKSNVRNQQGGFLASGAMPILGARKGSFLYSVALLTALFDNGVQKQGYGVLLKDGYILAAADLMNEDGAYLRSVMAKMQDDSSKSLMCFAMLRLRATDSKLSLLRAENYTDIYCNTREESFYHQRINLHYFTPIYKGMLKNTILSRSDTVLFPFVTGNNALFYKSSSIANIQKHSAIHGLPLFNSSGHFVGFLYNMSEPKKRNIVVSSDEVRDFVCDIAKRKLLPTSDLTRACIKNSAAIK